MGLDGSRRWKERTVFWLGQISVRSWVGIARFAGVVERFDLAGPFEVSLALPNTEGALLGSFAEGWAEPGSIEYSTDPCPEKHVLIGRELDEWPKAPDGWRALAFGLAAQIEDAWGEPVRRFLAYRGECQGDFDPRSGDWR